MTMVVANDSFTPTYADYNHIRLIVLAPSILGICICFLVLMICGIVACFARSKKELDRVSFRLLNYALISNIVYGIAYLSNPEKPSVGCQVEAFVVNIALTLSTFFTTCIAINLQFVLVHGLNGKRMEKYYVSGTILLSMALNIPTAALHHFGWDKNQLTCWFAGSDPRAQLPWIIASLSFPIALAATIECISSFIVLVWLYNYKKRINHLSRVNYAAQPGETIRNPLSDPRTLVRMDAKYRQIIIRIVMYPVVSLILNCTTVGLDLDAIMAGLHTRADFRILIIDLCIYGVRTLSYGILAAADPAFVKAVRQLFLPHHTERCATRLNFAPATLATDTACSHTTMHATNLERKDAGKMEGMGRNLTGDTNTGSISLADRTENPSSQIQIEEIQCFTRQL